MLGEILSPFMEEPVYHLECTDKIPMRKYTFPSSCYVCPVCHKVFDVSSGGQIYCKDDFKPEPGDDLSTLIMKERRRNSIM